MDLPILSFWSYASLFWGPSPSRTGSRSTWDDNHCRYASATSRSCRHRAASSVSCGRLVPGHSWYCTPGCHATLPLETSDHDHDQELIIPYSALTLSSPLPGGIP
ncbi:hypothetical protein BDV11DRAFT_187779, partial [Aspergillus similis]